jgi:hypothetical protein
MSTTKDKNKINYRGVGWEAAIREAEKQIYDANKASLRLKESIAIFKKKLKTGEPWPGEAQNERRESTIMIIRQARRLLGRMELFGKATVRGGLLTWNKAG